MPWWIGLLLFGPPSFALGVLCGRLSEQEYLMPLRKKLRALYDTLAPVLFFALAIVATVGVWLGATASLQNGRDQITGCDNANESRAGALALWDFIFDVSTASNPDPTRHEQQLLRDLRHFAHKVYRQHDCTDLSRKYPVPSPPEIPKLRGKP